MAEQVNDDIDIRAIARAEVRQELTTYRLELDRVVGQVAQLTQLVRGDESIGLVGLMSRLEMNDRNIRELLHMEEARARREAELKAQLKGLLIGLGVTGIGSLGTLAAVVRLLVGGP